MAPFFMGCVFGEMVVLPLTDHFSGSGTDLKCAPLKARSDRFQMSGYMSILARYLTRKVADQRRSHHFRENAAHEKRCQKACSYGCETIHISFLCKKCVKMWRSQQKPFIFNINTTKRRTTCSSGVLSFSFALTTASLKCCDLVFPVVLFSFCCDPS